MRRDEKLRSRETGTDSKRSQLATGLLRYAFDFEHTAVAFSENSLTDLLGKLGHELFKLDTMRRVLASNRPSVV
jgi:hypothetical protein